jgi:AcrR family transcriptional regulator
MTVKKKQATTRRLETGDGANPQAEAPRRVARPLGLRDQGAKQTRARIADAALSLFLTRGYTEMTFEHIAEAADVGRRTIFRHFPTKEAMLFDHLVVRPDFALERLRQRSPAEPPLVTLYTVLRDLCEQGYDRRHLDQIRAVLDTEPRLAGEQYGLSAGVRAFDKTFIAAFESRLGPGQRALGLQALSEMAEGWYITAVRLYLKQGRRSLVKYFDEVVVTCVHASARDLPFIAGQQRAASRTQRTRARGHRQPTRPENLLLDSEYQGREWFAASSS